MTTVVMKFGGTSVANVERIRNVARHVKREVDAGNQVAVVVSAMSGTTNQLVGWVRETALAARRARIRRRRRVGRAGHRRPARHRAAVDRRPGPVLAGLADPDPDRRRARHGPHHRHSRRAAAASGWRRARSPSSPASRASSRPPTASRRWGAAAPTPARSRIAAALKADRCDIYTDVDGVYTTDPRIVPKARRLERISYEEMLEMASLGAKVLQTRSVELAMVHRVRTRVLSSFMRPTRCRPPPRHLARNRHHRLRRG